MSDEIVDKKQKLLCEYLLADREIFVKCIRITKASYFEAPLDRVVEFVIEYFGKYHNIPNADIIEAETGILLKDREIDDTEKDFFLDEYEQHCRNAAMTAAILQSVDFINEGNTAPIQDLVRDALMIKIDNSLGTDLFENPLQRISSMNTNVDQRSIGIPELDELIGYIRRGELGVFFAQTAGGKSVTLANIIKNLASCRLDGLVISLELNEDLYSKRLDAIVTGIDISKHSEMAADIHESLKNIELDWGRITTKKMAYGTTPADIRAVVLEYHLKYGKYPDFLVVDYLALMGSGKSGRSMNKFDEDEIKAFGLRDMCSEYDMYGFTAGQINREGYDVKTLGPNHVAGGISVINAADWAVGLVATEEDVDNNQVQAVQMKIRNGAKTRHPVTLYRCPKTLVMSAQPLGGKKLDTPVKKTSDKKNPVPSGGKEKLKAVLNRR